MGKAQKRLPSAEAIGIAAIGLMRDAMLEDDEATTALWNDLEQAADGSGLLTIRSSETFHTGEADIAYVSKTTMDALAAMATALQELRAAESQDDTILPADSETLLKHISDVCSSAGLNGTYVADSPRAGITLDMLQSDFTIQQVANAGRCAKVNTFSRFVCSITGGTDSPRRSARQRSGGRTRQLPRRRRRFKPESTEMTSVDSG